MVDGRPILRLKDGDNLVTKAEAIGDPVLRMRNPVLRMRNNELFVKIHDLEKENTRLAKLTNSVNSEGRIPRSSAEIVEVIVTPDVIYVDKVKIQLGIK